MSSQNIRLEFSDLRNFSQHELDRLPSNKLFKICISYDALISKKYDETSIIEFTLKNIFIGSRIHGTTIDYIQTFTTYLLNFVSKVLTFFKSSLDSNSIKKLLHVTEKLVELTTSLSNAVQQVPVSIIHLILEVDLKIVEKHYEFFQDGNKNFESLSQQCNELLNELFRNCQMLQSMVVNFTINHIGKFTYSREIDCEDLNNVFQSLCSVAEFVTLVDVKTTADVWKCISRLGSENCNLAKTQNISTPWLRKAIEFLCNEIIQSVQIILENMKEDDTQFLTKLERILKVNSFYLKIIIKFATDFGCYHFQGHENVVNLSIALNSLPRKIEDTKIGESIRQYLTVGVSNLVGELYKSPDFEKAFLSKEISSELTFKAHCLLWNEVIEHCIESGDVLVAAIYLHEKETNIFGKIMHESRLYPTIILQQKIYENLVTTTAAAIISSTGQAHVLKYFENTLLKGILNGTILQSFICTEIMCILFRFAKEDPRFNYFKFYMTIALESPPFTFQQNFIFIKYLLQSFYTILSDKQKKVIVGELLNGSSSKERAVKMALILNGATDYQHEEFETIAADFDHRLPSMLQDFVQNPSKDAYYELAKGLTLARPQLMTTQLQNPASKLWSQCLSMATRSNSVVLINSLTNFLIRNNSTLLGLDNKLLDIQKYKSLTKVHKLSIIKILVRICELNMISDEVKSKVIASLIDGDSNFSLYTIQYVKTNMLPAPVIANIPRMDTAKRDKFMLRIASQKFEHSCKSGFQEEMEFEDDDDWTALNPSKRPCTVEASCPLLSQSKCMAEEVSRYFESNECSREDLNCIKEIISIYSSVVNK